MAYNRDSRPDTVALPTSSTPSARLRQVLQYATNDRLSTVTASQWQAVLNWSYAYDALDRATSQTQGNADYSIRRIPSYDNMGRLNHWSDTEYTPGDPYTECEDPTQIGGEGCTTFFPIVATPLRNDTYTYDAVGNRTDRGGTVQTGNRLSSFNGYTMTYDDDGNLLTKSGNGVSQSLTWNGLGQLASVTTNGSTTAFGYDGLGRRVRKTTSGVSTYFLYDGDNIVMQLSGTGSPQLEFSYYPGVDQPHAVRNSSTGAIYYYLTGQSNNVTALVSSTGQVVNQYAYTPFGQTIGAIEQIAQPFRFTARQLDNETGLYYYRARYYDPAIARFVSEDPIGLAGGVNQFAYVGNDPVNLTDPSGLCVKFSDGKVVCEVVAVTAPYTHGHGSSGESTNFGNQNARGRGAGPTSTGGAGGTSNVVGAIMEWWKANPCSADILRATVTTSFDILLLGKASAALGGAKFAASNLLTREGLSLGARGLWNQGGRGAYSAGVRAGYAAAEEADMAIASGVSTRLYSQIASAAYGPPGITSLDAFLSFMPGSASGRAILKAVRTCAELF